MIKYFFFRLNFRPDFHKKKFSANSLTTRDLFHSCFKEHVRKVSRLLLMFLLKLLQEPEKQKVRQTDK